MPCRYSSRQAKSSWSAPWRRVNRRAGLRLANLMLLRSVNSPPKSHETRSKCPRLGRAVGMNVADARASRSANPSCWPQKGG